MTNVTEFAPIGESFAPQVLSGTTHLKNEIAIWRQSIGYCWQLVLTHSTRRTGDIIHSDYGKPSLPYDWNTLSAPCVVRLDGHLTLVSLQTVREQIVDIIHSAIIQTEATRVLEVGCGEGLNIGLLAARHPTLAARLSFEGFDLVQQRVDRSKDLMFHLGLSNAKLWQGDATSAQVPASSVDLAYSVHAIEQIQEGWREAITQMHRAAPFVLLIEPFYERKSLGGKLHSRRHGYFRGKIRDVLDIGFNLLKEFDVGLRDPFNPSTALLLERR